MRDDLQDVALQRKDEEPASLELVGVFVLVAAACSLDEVKAVLCKAKAQR